MSYICSVTRRDGLVVSLRALYCQATYADHLEGPVTSADNDRRIRAMIKKASTLFSAKPVHLLEPARTTGRTIDGYQFEGQPVRRETLPPICCIGDFAVDVVPGAKGCASALVVVWFQPDPPPILIEQQLANIVGNISWNDLATSYWD